MFTPADRDWSHRAAPPAQSERERHAEHERFPNHPIIPAASRPATKRRGATGLAAPRGLLRSATNQGPLSSDVVSCLPRQAMNTVEPDAGVLLPTKRRSRGGVQSATTAGFFPKPAAGST